MTTSPKHTILSPTHEALGARMVDFSGWYMPVQYSGILEEHRAVREKSGIFDISHMGEFFVSGAAAAAWLDSLLPTTASTLAEGTGVYTFLLNHAGGVIDDLLLYRLEKNRFLLVVNAAKIEEDEAWMLAHLPEGADLCFENLSDSHLGLAVQGPESASVFSRLFQQQLPEKNRILPVELCGINGWAGITGYTGELGFELFFPFQRTAEAVSIWEAVLACGTVPCGLGARDTLRLEMCYPLNGSDLSPEITPLQAGLGFFVNLEKSDFPGKSALLQQKQTGLPSRLSAIAMDGKAPPVRPHYPVICQDQKVAETTSGALSPSLGFGIAMAYLPPEASTPGTPLEIEIRGRRFPARVVKKPFYKK